MRKMRAWALSFLLIFAIVELLASSAKAATNVPDWEKAAHSVEKLKLKFELQSKKLGWQCCLGTMYNEYMVPEHHCE